MSSLMRRRYLSYLLLTIASLSIALLNLTIGWHASSLQASTSFPGASSAVRQDLPEEIRKAPERYLPFSSHPEPKPRPPLDSIVQDYNVTGDASWLLNFAITGFPKCGTSTLMLHLETHPEVQIFKDERCDVAFNKQARLVTDLYNDFPAGDYVRGTKCPMDLESTALGLRNYDKYFPKTDFIVGIRHPVLWFESFYNFRVHNEFPMPPIETLIGKCRRGMFNLCTFRANFHIPLANLGKTNITQDPEEYKYVDIKFRKRSLNPVPPSSRRVFLYDVSQLSQQKDDVDGKRAAQFRVDLQKYLRLEKPIPPMIWFKPGINHTDSKVIQATRAKKIDICSDKYIELRSVLMKQALDTSRWIREFFVPAKDVYVSSPDYFLNTLMPSWERDPCLDRKAKLATSLKS